MDLNPIYAILTGQVSPGILIELSAGHHMDVVAAFGEIKSQIADYLACGRMVREKESIHEDDSRAHQRGPPLRLGCDHLAAKTLLRPSPATTRVYQVRGMPVPRRGEGLLGSPHPKQCHPDRHKYDAEVEPQ
jgi:hypothetical protein